MTSATFTRLTAPGPSALQLYRLDGLDATLRDHLNAAFSKPLPKPGQIRHGLLRDAEGIPLDDILLENDGDALIVQAHGGPVTAGRLTTAFAEWGFTGRALPEPTTLADEILRAVAQAATDTAARVLAAQFALLPGARDPGALLASWDYGRSLVTPTRYVLVGEPNAGKSSLLNRLAGDDRALVSEVPGTTRDLLVVQLVLDGRPVEILDGAGLRETDDALETAGQELLRARLVGARSLWVVRPGSPAPCPVDDPVAVVMTHADEGPVAPPAVPRPVVHTGLGDRGEAVIDMLRDWLPPAVDGPVIFTERQRALAHAACQTGSWDPEAWRGETGFPVF